MNRYEQELLTYFKLVIYDLNITHNATPMVKRTFIVYRNKLKNGATIGETIMRQTIELYLKKEFIIK